MRLRSTGLGTTELEAKLVNVKKVDDLVIFFVDVQKPVKWHTRMGFQERDLRQLVWSLLKPRNLSFVVKAVLGSVFGGNNNVPRTQDF
jgi:hypothetical protein